MLGDSYNNENHILPINSIQHCGQSRKLYTAGRDGTIKVWSSADDNLGIEGRPSATQLYLGDSTGLFKFQNVDLDEQLLKLETSICSSTLSPYNRSKTDSGYSVTNSYNVHFDWINDLQLVNDNTGLVSCSSDLSIKYISLDSDDGVDNVHKFQNHHIDYIKKLSYIPHEKKLVSGGLDGKIVVWDLNTLSGIQQLENTSSSSNSNPNQTINSIYSLATGSSGLLVGCGGPNNTVNLFDLRQSTTNNPFIKKLIGHQDNIRCLLMNDNFILSGSSDTTIKLWDIRNFKVLQTFEIHDDPVWSLTSSNSLKTFYSGDKSGLIIKTDLTQLSANRQPLQLNGADYYPPCADEKLGLLTIISKPTNDASPILSLCVESLDDDEYTLLASTNMALDRYHIPDTSDLAKYQYLRTCAENDLNILSNGGDLDLPLEDGASAVADVNDLNSGFYDLVSHLSMETNNYDLQSSVSGVNYPLSIHNNEEPVDTNDYNSLFLSIHGGPSHEFVNYINKENEGGTVQNIKIDKFIDKSPIEILLNPLPEEQITLIPFNKGPFNQFPITPKSIIAKRLFNNKRHMIVLYLNGDIKIWDIFICRDIKSFPAPTDNSLDSSSSSIQTNGKEKDRFIQKRVKDMDDIFNKLQTMDTLNNWCEIEIKAGKLLVMIKESIFDNTKIYYDELVKNYPFLAFEHSDNVEGKKNTKVRVESDERFFLSRIFLNSIFHRYVLYEWEFDHYLRAELKLLKKSSKSKKSITNGGGDDSSISIGNNSVGTTDEANTSPLKRIKMFSRKSSKNNIPQLQQLSLPASPQISIAESTFSASETGTTDVSEFISFNHETISDLEKNPAFKYDDSIMKLIQINKERYREKYQNISKSSSKLVDSLLSIYSNDPKYESKNRPPTVIDESKLIYQIYKPLINPQRLPSNLLIIILEHSPELGNLRDLCSFHLDEIQKLSFSDSSSGSKELINNLRLYLPKWIGQPILYDFFPNKEGPKIAFQLVEMDYTKVPSNKKIGGKTGRKIKKLPIGESSIKLSSHNMLRVSKILWYLTDKFESRTAEMKDHKQPHEWLVLECKDEVLPNSMTLQTIKTKIWKSSADIVLQFRRRYDE